VVVLSIGDTDLVEQMPDFLALGLALDQFPYGEWQQGSRRS
jgi:hypothetical protein